MDAAYLAEIRAVSTAELVETGATAIVRHYGIVETDLGGETKGPPTDTGPFPVNVQEDSSPSERTVGGGRVASVTKLLAALPWDTEVEPTDELVVTNPENETETFEVIDTNSAATQRYKLYASIVRTR